MAGLRQRRRRDGPPDRSHRTPCCASSANPAIPTARGRHQRHQFWPDSLSLLDQSHVDPSRLLEATQLTDTYLLALAVHRGGRLVSFDRRLSCEGVAGGREALWLIEA